jgi:putative phosphoribosyl transferase
MREFRDRREAGVLLGEARGHLQGDDAVVLALPRGGVPVGFEVARALAAPLDVVVVRKLGVPLQRELGMGAIGEGGVRVLDESIMRAARVTPGDLERVEVRERAELERRVNLYRGDRPIVAIAGRTAIVVDDGIATGGTARAALQVVRASGAGRVVLAVPVAAPESIRELAKFADEMVALATPSPMVAIGPWYRHFDQTTDDEVRTLLAAANRPD